MNILFVVRDIGMEHLGIMTLSSVLKKADHYLDIVDARLDKIKRKLKNNNFTIIAYSAITLDIRYYLNLNRQVKEEFDIFSVFGGPHPTYFPEIIHEPGVDGVCIGEGDYALLDLVNNLTEGKPITNIANWWIKQDGQIFCNSVRPLIKDLDSLCFADRTLFPAFYRINIVASRGCPFKCSFCHARTEFRCRSVDNVIEELKEAKTKTQARFVWFQDLTFNFSVHWLREFSEKYRKEIGLPFSCFVRSDLVTSENMRYLKEAGCFSVSMGIETASDYLRNEIFKKGISKKQIISAAQIIKRYKIKLRASNILCIPGSLEDSFETLRLNIQCRPDYAVAAPLFIYSHTDLCNFLVDHSRFNSGLNPKDYYLFWRSHDYMPNTRKIKNLCRLFSIAVEFPFLLPLLPFLIKFPLYYFYSFLFFIWGEYFNTFRILGGRLLRWKEFIRGLKRNLRRYSYFF